jgi:hypothetical protein
MVLWLDLDPFAEPSAKAKHAEGIRPSRRQCIARQRCLHCHCLPVRDCFDFCQCDGVKRADDLIWALGLEPDKLQPEVACGAHELGACREGRWVGHHSDPERSRDELMQDFEPLCVQLRGENAHPSRIPSLVGK